MNKLSCEIVQDLLPLYYDDVCSPDTRKSIEAHLATCAECTAALRKLQQSSSLPFEVVTKNQQDSHALASFKGYWKRSRTISFAKGLILATAVCGVLLTGYFALFSWNLTQVPASAIEITEVSQLQDGRIAYHVKLTDGYRLNKVSAKAGDDGILYITPMRPVFKSRTDEAQGLGNRYDVIDAGQLSTPSRSIKAVYYGPKDDHPVLIWKQGMELPPASEAVEAQFERQN